MPASPASEAEASHVSRHGRWLLLAQGELCLPFGELPWFARASGAGVLDVGRLSSL